MWKGNHKYGNYEKGCRMGGQKGHRGMLSIWLDGIWIAGILIFGYVCVCRGPLNLRRGLWD